MQTSVVDRPRAIRDEGFHGGLYLPMSGDRIVQAFVAEDPTTGGEDAFRSVTCTVCARVHLVNPRTGKVVGDRELS
jgi:hypothetical protein